jgi:hypothetical protein
LLLIVPLSTWRYVQTLQGLAEKIPGLILGFHYVDSKEPLFAAIFQNRRAMVLSTIALPF